MEPLFLEVICGCNAGLKTGEDVRLISRNRINFGDDYPQLIDALKPLSVKQAIIDGEIAALDDEGKSSFQLLQSYGKAKQPPLSTSTV